MRVRTRTLNTLEDLTVEQLTDLRDGLRRLYAVSDSSKRPRIGALGNLLNDGLYGQQTSESARMIWTQP